MAIETTVPPVPQLTSAPGAKSGSVRLIDRLLWKVGRSAKNEVVITDEMVSRSHAIIQRDGENHYNLIDLGSRNGSYVNDQRVLVPITLKNGDRIRFGSQHFTFENPLGDEEIPPPGEDVSGDTETQLLYSLKPTTVLVVDIRDFTGLAQRMDEATLARTIGTWIDNCGTVLSAHQSWCQKYIGDAIMAVWVESGDSYIANKAVLALAALRRILAVTERLQERFGLPEPIRIGAGMETGFASIANLGSAAASDYTALGDCVNRAFRLETATKALDVDFLVGQEAYSYLKAGGADVTPFESHVVTLKGYEKPAPCYGIAFDKISDIAADLDIGDTDTTRV